MKKEVIVTSKAPQPITHNPQAIKVGPPPLIAAALVELHAIGTVPDHAVRKQVIQPAGVPPPSEHCPPAVRAGRFLFHSGLPATDFKTGIPVGKDPQFPNYRDNAEDQIDYVLGNMEQCAKAAGTSLANAVKSQHYHVDRNDFHAIDRIWKQYMPVPPPRSSM